MRLTLAIIFSFTLMACVNHPRNFKPVGFNSADEAELYVPDYLYYANKLTDEEWDAFYQKFPEYWKDLQKAKSIGFAPDYHPWYTAYSFKWNTGRRKGNWSDQDIERLNQKRLKKGDTIFKVIDSWGVPTRVIWDNDFEILTFRNNVAVVFIDGVYAYQRKCKGCFKNSMATNELLLTLDLQRPSY
tara:strand:- start:1033 stop:1590 length:558 start_codon:yes stop_codon:yes gene_type:complete